MNFYFFIIFNFELLKQKMSVMLAIDFKVNFFSFNQHFLNLRLSNHTNYYFIFQLQINFFDNLQIYKFIFM